MPSPIFAFVSDGYYFNNGNSTTSRDLPDNGDLSACINASKGPRYVTALFGGPNDEYLFKTRHDNASEGVPRGISVDSVQFIAWGPEGQFWLKLADGRTRSNNLASGLSDHLYSNHPNISRVSFGKDSRWAAVGMRGGWKVSAGTSQELLSDIRDNGSGVRNIVLCPWDEDYYWVELIDGAICYNLPSAWKPSIDRRL